MKQCTKCNEIKPLTEFHNDKSKRDGLRERCKDCRCKFPKVILKHCVACSDSFEVSGRSKAQKYCGVTCQKVHIRFGIDEYQYEDLLMRSDYKCAICSNPETNIDKRTGKVYELSLDHDHKTGIVRGVLCTSCNAALGYFKDDISLMAKAIQYLNEAKEGGIPPKIQSLLVYKKHKKGEISLN